MKERFFELAAQLSRELHANEVLLCNFAGERSDFVRFNRARVRQAGSVEQRSFALRLVRDKRQASATVEISGGAEDFGLLRQSLGGLRDALGGLPEDPWLSYNETPRSTDSVRRGALPVAEDVVAQAIGAAEGHDLAGFYAAGTLCRGFANSLGQRNWHEVDSFNFDWSLHGAQGRAAKASYAGTNWIGTVLEQKIHSAAGQLALLEMPDRAIAPSEYRAYLAPRAMEELAGLLCWGGFSARSRATKQSPLLRMQGGQALSPRITLLENTAQGVAPGFQADGFVKPPRVALIEGGRLGEALVSPRSAKEFGLETNAANGGESPESLDLAPGTLEERNVLAALERGLYASNLWYLNYSDRAAGRITGMTRFATFWVQGGRIAAPVGAMRFDDSVYRLLGENLLDLTREREMLLDPSTYGGRSSASAHLPGALLSALRFTL
ncbi:MAG: metallopeptidase TldD-related protein [Burkholderiales bacterium]